MSYTVAELRDILDGYDDDLEVVVCSDGEGNRVAPLDDVNDGTYRAETSWRGELLDPEDLDDAAEDYEKDVIKPVLVLWPAG